MNGCRGVVTVEVAALVMAIVAAMVFMLPYAQRGLQSYLKGSVDQVGHQFDPRDRYREQKNSQIGDSVESVNPSSGMSNAAQFRPSEPHSSFGGQFVSFEDTPGGLVPREPSGMAKASNSGWSSTTIVEYCDERQADGCL